MHSSTGWYSVAYWQKAVVSSLTILSLVVMTGGPLFVPAVANATSFHSHKTHHGEQQPVGSATNPTLANSCGLDIALVLDVSQSISSSELATMKTDFNSFVTTLAPTPTMFSVTKFARTGSVVNAFTAVEADTHTAINGVSISGLSGTNFEDGLRIASSTFDPRASKPNVIILASDGNPNRKGSTGVSASEAQAEAAAIVQANAIKASGTRIITVGIGNNLDANNLIKISSPDAYYAANYADLGDALHEVATDLCGGTITIHKMIDVDGNPETEDEAPAGAGWSFHIGGNITATTDSSSATPATEVAQGVYGISEVTMPGYDLESFTCSQGQPGEAQWDVTVGPLDIVSCTFVNKPNTGIIHVVKNVINTGGGTKTAADFSFLTNNMNPTAFEADGTNDLTVHVGTYSITEQNTPIANYNTSYVGCDDIVVTPHSNATCTITNTYVPPAQQCDANALMTIVSDTTTMYGEAATVPVDLDTGTTGNQIHAAWTASIPGATWIWGENPVNTPTADLTETFTKTFTIVGTPVGDASLMVAADNSYTVSLNGHDECLAAVTNDEFNYSAAGQDTCVIPQADLVTGTNTLTFTVKNWALVDGTAQSNPAGLLYKLELHANQCVQATCVADVNLLTNAGFEATSVGAAAWNIFPSGTPLLGWLVSWLPSVVPFNDVNPPAVANAEIQSTGLIGVTASEGSQWTELDADWDGPSGSLSGEPASVSLTQTIPTVIGQTYNVSFDTKDRDGADNAVEAVKDGVAQPTVTGATNGNGWTTHTYSFVATGATTQIAFRDAGATSNSLGSLLDNTSVMCVPQVVCEEGMHNDDGQCVPDTATLHATKIVCDAEQYLPNWGSGSGPAITASTAADFLETANGQHCHVQPGWTFQWAPASAGNPGDNVLDVAAASPWTSLGITGVDGTATVNVPVTDSYVWFREVLKTGYVPFSYNTGETPNSDANDVSAEVYCNTDHLHYDNWDRVDGLAANHDYYCVAFNAPVEPVVCPEGQHMDSETHQCVPTVVVDESCPSGQHLNDDDQCVPDGNGGGGNPIVCDAGTHLVGDTCVPNGGGGPIQGFSFGGGGGGNGPIGGQILGASCGLYMDKHLKFGSGKNDKEQVKKLQSLLNKYGFGPIPVTGFFGPATLTAVKAFQAKYGDDVLKPWGLNAPTGLVYLSTLVKINLLECPDLSLQLPPLVPWSANPNAQ